MYSRINMEIAICDDDIEFMSGLERFVKDYCNKAFDSNE